MMQMTTRKSRRDVADRTMQPMIFWVWMTIVVVGLAVMIVLPLTGA